MPRAARAISAHRLPQRPLRAPRHAASADSDPATVAVSPSNHPPGSPDGSSPPLAGSNHASKACSSQGCRFIAQFPGNPGIHLKARPGDAAPIAQPYSLVFKGLAWCGQPGSFFHHLQHRSPHPKPVGTGSTGSQHPFKQAHSPAFIPPRSFLPWACRRGGGRSASGLPPG